MVIKEALEYGYNNLSNCLYTEPLNESRKLLSFLLNKDLSYIYINQDFKLDVEVEKKFKSIIQKRKAGYPLEYIINSKYFYGREFYVDQGALIPRWDTENLIEAVKEYSNTKDNLRILEIGAGSGAISITMALEIPKAIVDGADISSEALEVCMINLEKYKLKNLSFYQSNLFENVKGKYDIIVSNPPYINRKDLVGLQIEVQKEPILALDGGEDGLDFYRKISKEAGQYLNSNGLLFFEIGYNQYEEVKKLLEENAFSNIEYKRDLQGYIRVIWGVKEEK